MKHPETGVKDCVAVEPGVHDRWILAVIYFLSNLIRALRSFLNSRDEIVSIVRENAVALE